VLFRPQALKPKQVAAMVGAADAENPVLLTVAAYAAKNGVHGNRWETENLLDWSEVQVHRSEQGGAVDGLITEIGSTKVDRTQVGEKKPLLCRTGCSGAVALMPDGTLDGSKVCPVHLMLKAKEVWEKKLKLPPGMHLEEAVFADYALWEDAPRGATVVALDDNSALMTTVWTPKNSIMIVIMDQQKNGLRYRRGMVLSEVEADGETLRDVTPNSRGLWFEVEGKPYLVHAWASASQASNHLRSLAVVADKQAKKAGVEMQFGGALKVSDLKGVLSTKSCRQMMATESTRGSVPSPITMKNGGWTKESTMLKYVEDVDPFATAGINLTDVILGGRSAAASTDTDQLFKTLTEQAVQLKQAEEKIARLQALLKKHGHALDIVPQAALEMAAAGRELLPVPLLMPPAAEPMPPPVAPEHVEERSVCKLTKQQVADTRYCCNERSTESSQVIAQKMTQVLEQESLRMSAVPLQTALCHAGVHLERRRVVAMTRKRRRHANSALCWSETMEMHSHTVTESIGELAQVLMPEMCEPLDSPFGGLPSVEGFLISNEAVAAGSRHSTSVHLGNAAQPVARGDFSMAEGSSSQVSIIDVLAAGDTEVDVTDDELHAEPPTIVKREPPETLTAPPTPRRQQTLTKRGQVSIDLCSSDEEEPTPKRQSRGVSDREVAAQMLISMNETTRAKPNDNHHQVLIDLCSSDEEEPTAKDSKSTGNHHLQDEQISEELLERIRLESTSVQGVVLPKFERFNAEQRRAAHGILVRTDRVVMVSGPAGAGKSALLEMVAVNT
jgi:hypothetical protein